MSQILSHNADLDVRMSVDTNAMEWRPSPSGTVWRRRLHLYGPAEAGQVTSIVRYEPNSSFPTHEHPEGEEILVLSGTFSDHQGDWPEGSYLLNPEGFSHAPWSHEGCVLFVKLRQYPDKRPQISMQTKQGLWRGVADGVSVQYLFHTSDYPEQMQLERWDAGASWVRTFDGGAEVLVLQGVLEEGESVYEAGHWLRLPVGTTFQARSDQGCELYVKSNGLGLLRHP